MSINWNKYPSFTSLNTSDKIIVSAPDGNTKKVPASAIATTDTLQTVTNNGSTTTNNITLTGSLTGTTATFSGQVTIPATPVASTDAASKSYVDAQVGASDTLQEVTDNGNNTTNDINVYSGTNTRAIYTSEGSLSKTSNAIGIETDGSANKTRLFNNGNGTTLLIQSQGASSDIQLAARNQLTFWTLNDGTDYNRGSEKMRLTSGGNLGIGTTSPSQKLTVEGNIELGTGGYIYGDTTTPYLRLSNAAGSFLGYSNGYIGLGPSFVYHNASGEQFRISHSNGNVGIGTSNPSKKLHVSQTTDSQGVRITGYDNENDSHLDLYVDNFGNDCIIASEFLKIESSGSSRIRAAGYLRLESASASNAVEVNVNYLKFTTGGSERARLTNTGLGIGTSSPSDYYSDDLVISSADEKGMTIAATTTSATNYIMFADGTSGNQAYRGYVGYNHSSDYLRFGTSGSEKMRLTGNLLIGTTTDSGVYRLDVFGKARVQSVLQLDDVLTLTAISTPADPASGKSSIYMDSSDGAIKVKINVGGTVVTRTLASFEG